MLTWKEYTRLSRLVQGYIFTDPLMKSTDNKRTRLIKRIILIAASGILFIYILLSLLSPSFTISRLKEACLSENEGEERARGRELFDPELTELIRREAFLNSRIVLAETDSMGLCLNLKDSLITLEMEGVVLHRARIRDIHADPFFNSLNGQLYHCLFSVTLTVQSEHSTIIKEPVIVRKAPRDTAEAAKFFFQPDTVFRGPQSVQIELSHEILLILEECRVGENGLSCTGRLANRIRSALHRSSRNFCAMIRFRIPAYSPEIRISLPAKDIVSLYRALPEQAGIAVRF